MAEVFNPKPKWKIILGWVLFIWGLLGILFNIFSVLVGMVPFGSIIFINSIVCLIFIVVGYNLKKQRKPKNMNAFNNK